MANYKKITRPAIPEQVKRELWGRAAGHCEFRGCSKPVFKDTLTQDSSNLSDISHIVAYSPDGPRGDAERSPLLATDIRNLMLTCGEHGRLIDDKRLVDQYPESLLLEFKREHEERIRLLAESSDEAQTEIVFLYSIIRKDEVTIGPKDITKAIFPLFRAEEDPFVISLTASGLSVENDANFEPLARIITERVRILKEKRARQPDKHRLSVFALAPVPLLMRFGLEIGDIDNVDLFQKHRGSQGWVWYDNEAGEEFYEVTMPKKSQDDERPVALILSVSHPVSHDQVANCLGADPVTYEVRANEPSVDFLRSRTRLEMFGWEVRRTLDQLRTDYNGNPPPIHVFAAVPAPVAIEFGRNIKPFHPPFVLYEYHDASTKYVQALTLDEHKR